MTKPGVGRTLRATVLRVVTLAVCITALTACAGRPASSGGTVRVVGSWEGSELDAFLAVVAPFERRTGIQVLYSGTRDLRGAIGDALSRADPPDVAGLEGPAHMRELAEAGALMDLTHAIDVQAYKSSVAPTFVDLGTAGDRLVGTFVKSTLKGLIWYDPAKLRRGVPHTLSELADMAQLAMKGPTREWCVGLESAESSGWPGTDWIESFLLHDAGLGAYDRWVAGDLPWRSEAVRRAFESFGRVVAADAVFGGVEGALTTNFADAGDPLFADPPGCLLMLQGSFMPAFFDADGREPGRDYDFFPFPETDSSAGSSVIGGGDLMALMTTSPQAADLMDYLVSPEAQQLWVTRGGALSVNRRVSDYPNAVVSREASLLVDAAHFRFDGSDLMPASMNAAFWKAVLDFAADQSRLDDLLADLDAIQDTAYGH